MKTYTEEEALALVDWHANLLKERLGRLFKLRAEAASREQEWAIGTADRMIATDLALIEMERASAKTWGESDRASKEATKCD